MNVTTVPPLTALRKPLNTAPDAFGWLRDSSEVADDADALRARMAEDGYLFLPGRLHRDEVLDARRVIVERLHERGWLHPDHPPMEAVVAPEKGKAYFMPDLAEGNAPLMRVLYDGPLMDLFARLFGGPVRHFDFTWMRAVSPGGATAPHCDIVYMGRGTRNLYTAWTPLGDIPLEIGGLMILENSHRRNDVLGEYLRQDVDSYCENGPNAEKVRTGALHWEHWDGSGESWDGSISHDPAALRAALGGRWLTAAEYRAGDVLIFSIKTVHASLDNRSDRIRLSSDTRYQRAGEPVDERWVGDKPVAHGLAAKRGRIC